MWIHVFNIKNDKKAKEIYGCFISSVIVHGVFQWMHCHVSLSYHQQTKRQRISLLFF